MARPTKEGLDYFPHDTDASSDEKVEALTMLYGAKGYAFYFILLERIYRSSTFELDVSDAETIQILSRKMSVTTEEFHQILKSALKHKCFDKEKYESDSILTSNGIKKRAGVVVEKREKMRSSYENRKRIVSDAETTQETTPETPQSKVKKSKEKKSNNIYSDYSSNPDVLQAIKDFIDMRNKLKKPMTERAKSMMLKKLSELANADEQKIAILQESVLKSWTDIYPLKGELVRKVAEF